MAGDRVPHPADRELASYLLIQSVPNSNCMSTFPNIIAAAAVAVLLFFCIQNDHAQTVPEISKAKPVRIAVPQPSAPKKAASFAHMANWLFAPGHVDCTAELVPLIAAMEDAKAGGMAPATWFDKELGKDRRFSPVEIERIRTCLFQNWSIAHTYGLVTPENLDRMRRGEAPLATNSSYKGQPFIAVCRGEDWVAGVIPMEVKLIPAATKKAFLAGAVATSLSPSRNQSVPQQATWTVDVPLGAEFDLGTYGLSQCKMIVRTADRTSGIQFSVMDNSRKVEKKIYVPDLRGVPQVVGTRKVSEVRPSSVPMRSDAIPGTTQAGTRILESYPLTIYATDSISFPGRCQLVIQRATGVIQSASATSPLPSEPPKRGTIQWQ